jgi:hypothetical protein
VHHFYCFSLFQGSIQYIYSRIILYSGIEEKKTQNSGFSQYSISRIYFIFRDLNKLNSTEFWFMFSRFNQNGILASDNYPEWDPSFIYLSRTGSQLIPPISPGIHRDPGFIFTWVSNKSATM